MRIVKKASEERAKTGVPGMDEIIGGGLPKGSLTLLTGTAGTGKTVFGTQFAFNGATQFGENSIYLSVEEPIEHIKESCKVFGWDFDELEKNNKIIFVKYDPFHIEDIIDILETNIRKNKAQRVVIDSISALGLYVRDIPEIRRMIFNLSLTLYKQNCTSLIISEIPSNQKDLSRFGVEEFVVDGVIVLYYLRADSQYSRSLTVWKMRGTEHSQKLHPYAITKKGIVVYPREEAFVKIR